METLYPVPQGENASLATQGVYNKWLERDCYARLAILVSMQADLMGQFEFFQTTMEMWQKLKITFG